VVRFFAVANPPILRGDQPGLPPANLT
jgi:hypothetical protein